VLPRIIAKLENAGCEKSIVGLVVPMGYSFNLDGTCLYLATASVFLAQATNTHFDLSHQIGLLLILLVTSKGAAGIAGAAFVVLAATLAAGGTIPVASVALVLGVHRLMSQGLTPTNLLGNAMATIHRQMGKRIGRGAHEAGPGWRGGRMLNAPIGRMGDIKAGLSSLVAALAVAGSIVVAGAGAAGAADPQAQQVLAPTGRLRVGLYPGTPTSILPDTQSGGPRGVGYDLGKEFAHRLGVPFEPVVFAKNAEVLEAVKTGQVDMVFTNASAARARDMDFGPAYLEIELGYLVPKGSPVSALANVDKQGVRVGVTTASSSDAALSRDLKSAQIVRAATVGVATDMLASGQLDAYATNKATLFEMMEKLPGATVLDGQWGVERHAIAIPKGRDQGRAFVEKFTEDAKSEGLVKAAIARAGLRGAVVSESK
jgi:polar amino acid transport system substrate-binding protein